MSSDFGTLLLRGVDRQSGLTERLAAALHDTRHPSSMDHPLRALLAQRLYPIASGSADANDANRLRQEPLFTLGGERRPLDPAHDLARAPTFSRLGHQEDRKDLYRLTTALVEHLLAHYPAPPAAMVLDREHSDAPTSGQQEVAFSTHHYPHHCSPPLCIFDGTSHARVTTALRPGPRPPGAENAMIWLRLWSYLRRHWPHTHLLVRGESHVAPPEVRDGLTSYRGREFVLGRAGHAVLRRQAAPVMHAARRLPQQRVALAPAHGETPPTSRRRYEAFPNAAQSWAQRWRVVLQAAGMRAGEPPRLVVTARHAPTPQRLYDDR